MFLCLGEYRGIKKANVFLRYVVSKYKEQQKEMAYRIYVAECFRIMTENTAKQGGGSYINKPFADVIGNSKPKDERTADEIIADITKRAGLEVI